MNLERIVSEPLIRKSLLQDLNVIYRGFFKNMGIDPKTGLSERCLDMKFVTYPYIGSRYGASAKVLFVGLDVGQDTKPGRVQGFEERRESIESKVLSEHNQHISGTYIAALYFLKDAMGWVHYWNEIKHLRVYKGVLLNIDKLPLDNPLSYVSLTNCHKFNTVGRKTRRGGEDRKYLDESEEWHLFREEIELFDPAVIIFQGKDYRIRKKAKLLKELTGKDIRICPHSSYVPCQWMSSENFINLIRPVSP